MVQADAGDQRHFRQADIGRIESSAQADLDDRHIDPPPDEMKKAQGGGHFKEGRGHPAGGELDLYQQAGQLRRGDGLAVDLNAFLDAAEMGRGEQAGVVAGPAKDGRQHGGRRAFALAAGHVHDAQALLRITKALEQPPHTVELEVARLRQALLVVDPAKPECQRTLVIRRRGARERQTGVISH